MTNILDLIEFKINYYKEVLQDAEAEGDKLTCEFCLGRIAAYEDIKSVIMEEKEKCKI